jgi:tetratricopeptide (TPR) repeat protein
MNPQFLQAYQNLGVVLAARGNRAAADSAWRDGLRLFPQEVGLYNNIGANLEAAGRLDPAIEAYRTALNLAPETATRSISRLLQSANRLTRRNPAGAAQC